jgi:uncharacterized protein YdhG (YjbR/CyaY superfamily)
MKTNTPAPTTIDEYISGFPGEVQALLEKIRAIVKKAAPKAQETISYGIPTFTLRDTYLIYFAAYKKHIAIYPVPTGNDEFNEEVSAYRRGKGTLQFPLDKPFPYALLRKIVKHSLQDNLIRAETRKKKKEPRA